MYMMRRIHAEDNGELRNVWVYQWQAADLSGLIATARFNLRPLDESREVNYWEDHRPDQKALPGCVWQGKCSHVFTDGWNASHKKVEIRSVTTCMIFNISKCWYSHLLSRETMTDDRDVSAFYDPVKGIESYVQLLSSNRGLGVCSRAELRKILNTEEN